MTEKKPKKSLNNFSYFGFSLVELMISVSIVIILAVIGLVIFTHVQKDLKDTRRLADIHQLQLAIEQYYYKHGIYPFPSYNSGCCDAEPSKMSELQPLFANGIPHDPDKKEAKAAVLADGRSSGFDYGYLPCIDEKGVVQKYFLCTYLTNCSGRCNVDRELSASSANYPDECADLASRIKADGTGQHFYCVSNQSN